MHTCDNCGAKYTDENLHPVVGRLEDRTNPGGIVPSGECAECGALCYPNQPNILSDKFKTDLSNLCSYIFESENVDFLSCLCNEFAYVEDGIITREEADELSACSDTRATEIAVKAAKNPNCQHVYAIAFRLYDAE